MSREHREPESPTVYEPADLYGRKHVEKVASQYQVREDECLADKLQGEEFELHFSNNKNARRLGQIDLKTAKEIYLREIEESGLLTKRELNQLCKDDKLIAKDIARRIQNEEELEHQRKAAAEMQDEEFARYLQAKERERLEQEKRRLRKRQIARDQEAARRLQEEMSEGGQKQIIDNRGNSDDDLYVEYNITPSNPPASAAAVTVIMADDHENAKKEAELKRDAEYARRLQALEKEKYDREMRQLRKMARERDMEEERLNNQREAENVERTTRKMDDISLSREKFITTPGKTATYTHHQNKSENSQQDVNPYETIRPDASVQQPTKKRSSLRSVDATGQPVGRSTFYKDENHRSSSKRDSYERRRDSDKTRASNKKHEQYSQDSTHDIKNHYPERKLSNTQKNEKHRQPSEPIYLQAVDAKQNHHRNNNQGQYFYNVAENIDPTYQKQTANGNDGRMNRQFEETPNNKQQASVIKNQKRSSIEKKEKKKKGSIFSKKN